MKRTTRLALPLFFIGSICIAVSWFDSHTLRTLPAAIGGVYFGVGLLLWRRPSPWVQGLAVVGWLPLMLIKPFAVVDALRTLLSDDANETPQRPTSPPPEASSREGRVNLICRLLGDALDVDFRAHFPDSSFRNVHLIAPGNLLDILDTLHREYGFAVSAVDGDQVDSVKDLLVLLELRHPYEVTS